MEIISLPHYHHGLLWWECLVESGSASVLGSWTLDIHQIKHIVQHSVGISLLGMVTILTRGRRIQQITIIQVHREFRRVIIWPQLVSWRVNMFRQCTCNFIPVSTEIFGYLRWSVIGIPCPWTRYTAGFATSSQKGICCTVCCAMINFPADSV